MSSSFKGYKVRFSKTALKATRYLPRKVSENIASKLETLTTSDNHCLDITKIQGWPYLRLVVGDYRVIFEPINHEVVVYVIKIGHRKDVYRDL